MKFSDYLSAQPKAWSILSRSFASGRRASAYLLHGRDGYGDWPLALCFAALLNCERIKTGDDGLPRPCGECKPCRTTFDVNYPGLITVGPVPSIKDKDDPIDFTNEFIDSRKTEPFGLLRHSKPLSIPINLARQVRRELGLKEQEDSIRTVILYRIDLMRRDAADALLKIMEEPPSDTVLILTTANLESIADTIRSRCQAVRLERVPEAFAIDYMTSRADVDENRARLLYRLSDGSLGGALASLHVEGEEVDRRSVGQLMFRTLCTTGVPELSSQLSDMYPMSDRGAILDLLSLWQSLVRDCAYFATTGDESGLVNTDFAVEIKRLSPLFHESSANAEIVGLFKNTLADLRRNVHIQPSLVAMAIKLRRSLPEPSGVVGREY